MKKTAMQDMIEWIEQRFNNPQETEVFKKATELLEKEKEQIIDFANCFYDDCVTEGGSLQQSAEEYYNQTYNQNK